MNKKRLTFAMACMIGAQLLSAQATIYDAVRVTGSDLNGTARYVGMGGAMSALGGDISTMSTNPAGIGIYRSSDAMISFGMQRVETSSDYVGTVVPNGKTSTDNIFGSFDNLGFVYSYKVGNNTPVRYVNFGFNYHKSKSFDRNYSHKGTYYSALSEEMANLANLSGASVSEFQTSDNYSPFENKSIPWLGVLGYQSYAINPWTNENGNTGGYDSYFIGGSDEADGVYKSQERGGLHDFDFNLSANIRNRVYLGATIGAHYLDYSRTSVYSEDYYDSRNSHVGGYDLTNYYSVDGSGIDLKLGVIVRPIENSPLRIGFSIATPTLYRLTEYQSATVSSDLDGYEAVSVNTNRNGYDTESETTYKVFTPWKYNLSLGYTVGRNLAVGAEYEYADYSTIKMKYDDGELMDQENTDASNMLNGVHTFKIGAEYKVIPEFAFRLGYNFISAAMNDEAFKRLPYYSARTDAEYSNIKSTNNFTVGIGYRGKSFYADLAYVYSHNRLQFHPFQAYEYGDNGMLNFASNSDFNNTSKVKTDTSKLVITLGMKF